MPNLEIMWTKVDEAPALATYSLLPIVEAFVGAAGVSVTLKDISLAGRIIATFPEKLTPAQRINDELRAHRQAPAYAMQHLGDSLEATSPGVMPDGAPPLPCSSQVYQVGLILARWATSSRRKPGVRRRPPPRPNAAGSRRVRRSGELPPRVS